MALVTMHLVGQKAGGRDSVLKQLSPQEGDRGLLIHEPDNEVDRNAVKVMLADEDGNWHRVGYLKASEAATYRFSPFGAPFEVTHLHTHPDTGEVEGFRIGVERNQLKVDPRDSYTPAA